MFTQAVTIFEGRQTESKYRCYVDLHFTNEEQNGSAWGNNYFTWFCSAQENWWMSSWSGGDINMVRAGHWKKATVAFCFLLVKSGLLIVCCLYTRKTMWAAWTYSSSGLGSCSHNLANSGKWPSQRSNLVSCFFLIVLSLWELKDNLKRQTLGQILGSCGADQKALANWTDNSILIEPYAKIFFLSGHVLGKPTLNLKNLVCYCSVKRMPSVLPPLFQPWLQRN
jgi:hypothetical protein